jgi:hypothetical protein
VKALVLLLVLSVGLGATLGGRSSAQHRIGTRRLGSLYWLPPLRLLARTVAPVRQRVNERAFRVSTAKRTTMSKMNRERELREKRELKQERKDQKKLAAATAAAIDAEAPLAAPSA